MSNDQDVAILSAHHLKLVFKAEGLTPLKVDILLPAHSSNSVRATYRAWLYDPAAHDSGDDESSTLKWEEGVAYFSREGTYQRNGGVLHFIPKEGGTWEHDFNAVSADGVLHADSPDLDEEVAKQWKCLKALLAAGLKLDAFAI